MSMKTLYAAATVLAMATPAMAQDTSPWDLRDRNAYVLDMQGKMWSKPMTTEWNWAVRQNARAVPKGTVFFMNNGQLYMARARHVRPRRQLHGRRRLIPARVPQSGAQDCLPGAAQSWAVHLSEASPVTALR